MNKFLVTTLSMIVIIAVGINIAKNIPDGRLHIIICDVGQGDGIVIVTPKNKHLLIDAGPDNTIQDCLGKHLAFYNRQIDGIIISHFHADHLMGFIDLFKSYAISAVIKDELNYPSAEKSQFEKEALEETKNIKEVWKGDEISIEPDVTLYTVWPQKDTWNRANGNWEAYLSDFNDSSIILLLKYKQAAILFTGDAGTKINDQVAEDQNFKDLIQDSKLKIYKIPHHGSRDAVSEKIISTFNPNVAAISSGQNNKFNHPHPEALEQLNKHNIPYYRTDQNGSIEFTTDGQRLWITVEKGKQP